MGTENTDSIGRRFDASHQTITQMEEIDYPTVAGTVVPRDRIKEFQIPVNMPFRRLYVYKEVALSLSSADYVLDAEIDFLKGGRSVGVIPIGNAVDNANTLLNRSIINACVRAPDGGGQDVVFAQLAKRFVAVGQFLSPHKFVMDAERMALNIKRAKAASPETVQQVKVVIYLESSTHPFE